MKHTTILILTTKNNIIVRNQINALIVHYPIVVCNDYLITLDQEDIAFDYLVILNTNLVANFSVLPLYKEVETIITNYYQQSSIEHIYYINENDLLLEKKLELAINHICYGE
jgi:hypothetical protein